MSNVERIAAALGEHKTWEALPPHWQTVACSGCDWKTQVPMTEDAGMAHRNHVAEVLAAAGIGHVPNALQQAADTLDAANLAQTPEGRIAVRELRARANQAGGDRG